MLVTYREWRDGHADTIELELHLEQCAACRQVLAQYSLIGEQIRSLPAIRPAPTAQAKLMSALAAEYLRSMQRSHHGTQPTPEFLKPYLQEHAQNTYATTPLVAFSTAETGPLPAIRTIQKRHHRLHMSQLTVIGLVAACLMVMMMGGLTTLLLLTHGNGQTAFRDNGSTSIHLPTNIVQTTYATSTPYPHVTSAVADREFIYYTAYGDGANSRWMLERLDRTTMTSAPLLAKDSTSPLIVLGSSNGWLVWLQLDLPKPTTHNNPLLHNVPVTTRTWSLHYLALSATSDAALGIFGLSQPLTLTAATFNQDSSSWVHTPVQGIWFIQNLLLVAALDGHGISHLLLYQLDLLGHSSSTVIATASPNHIFTSPTANDNGTEIYWADEWRSDDGIVHSNIWTQEVSVAPNLFLHGRWVKPTITVKQLFRSDGASFYPEVVANTLFLLRAANVTNTAQVGVATPGTPASTATTTGVPTTTPNRVSWADPAVHTAPLDASVHGTLLMLPLDDVSTTPVPVNTRGGQAWSPQAGTDFVLWQSQQGYQMFDVATTSFVNVGNAANNALFLAVNGETTVWAVESDVPPTPTEIGSSPAATLLAFNWPTQ